MKKTSNFVLGMLLIVSMIIGTLIPASAATTTSYSKISYNITQVIQEPSGCYTASVAMCGLWNGTLSGTPKEAYNTIYNKNGNTVKVKLDSLKHIGYKQIESNLTLSNLYLLLKKGPVIVGENYKGKQHYAVVYSYEGSKSSLSASGFKIMDTKKTVWRLSDSSQLTTNGKTTLDKWIKGSNYCCFTYYNNSKVVNSSNSTVHATTSKATGTVSTTNQFSNVESNLSIIIKSATNITQNSAKVSASCSYSGTRPSEVSVYIGTTKNNMKKYSSDKINHSKNPFDIWYNIKNLKPDTTYYYQFHAVVNGKDKAYGEIKSFETKNVSSTLSINVKGASKITKNSARVDATCSYSGTRPSEVSVYIGTSPNNMKKYSSDAINHSKNPFNIWYNLSGLKKNTTYYYQFHARVNGVDKAYGDIKSFKTAR